MIILRKAGFPHVPNFTRTIDADHFLLCKMNTMLLFFSNVPSLIQISTMIKDVKTLAKNSANMALHRGTMKTSTLAVKPPA